MIKKIVIGNGLTSKKVRSEFLKKQKYRCALCLKTKGQINPSKRTDPYYRIVRTTWCLDHCHKTGRLRGVLCVGCNIKISGFDQSKEWIERAITYVGNMNV